MRHIFVLAAVALLAACAGTPKSSMATIEVALTAADQAALAYITLPPCPQPSGILCSDTAVVKQIGAKEQLAHDEFKAAQKTVNDVTAAPDSMSKAVAAAQGALAALQAIIPAQR